MKKYIFVVICSLLVVSCIGFIWGNSAQIGEVSGEMSSEICEIVNDIVEPILQQSVSEHFVRKAAHFSEYLLLAVLSAADVFFIARARSKTATRTVSLSMLYAFPLCVAVSLVDEFLIQAATDGRGPSFIDVCIDASGAIFGIACSVGIFLIARRLSRVKKNELTPHKELSNTYQ